MLAASPCALLAQGPSLGGCPVFPADNVWNAKVDNLPVDANSAAYVSSIGPSSKLHPDYGAGGGVPYTFVTGDQPKVNVSFQYVSDAGPYPIPDNVAIEGGSDRHALVVDTTNCILYELFELSRQSDGSWTAGSGAIWNLNSDALRPDGWTSADAAGLPILPGLIRYDEVMSGQINHAIRFTAPQTRNTYIWPARHYASSLTGLQYPAMGQRFRLKASFNIGSFPHNVQVILQAMKTYGIILADNGASWFVQGVGDSRWNDDEMHQLTQVLGNNFEAVDESSLMVNYNSGQAASAGGSSQPGTGIPTGWVNIVSKNSGKCLDIPGGATAKGIFVRQWTCVGGLNQEFQFTAVNGGYKITARQSGLQLDVSGASSADSALILQWPYWGGSNEIWNATQTSDGYYNILPISDQKCMDVRGASTNDGAAIQQYTCWGGDDQKWSFVPAS